MERYREKNRDGQAKCRRCGNYWPVGDFTIEPSSKIPMCSVCLKEVTEGKPVEIKKSKEPFVERIDEEKVKRRCKNCNYVFNYDKIERKPEKCPYCNVKIR